MQRLKFRQQRTICHAVEVAGVGFLSGADVRLRFVPAPPDSGIQFVRTDLHPRVRVPAHVSQVTGTSRRTTLGKGPGEVSLVEHALAALAGLRIDNCTIELNASEPPGLDGSAGKFAQALGEAGAVIQSGSVPVYATKEPVRVTSPGSALTLYPPSAGEDDLLKVTYILDYGPQSPIDRQMHTLHLTADHFLAEVAQCRTFILAEEIDAFRQQGIGTRLTASDLLIFGSRGLEGNELRFANEPARHKCLDCVGDLALCGFDLRGHLVAYRSGHPLNVELARTLSARVQSRAAA